MAAQIIDGKTLSKRLRVGFRERVRRLQSEGFRRGTTGIDVTGKNA